MKEPHDYALDLLQKARRELRIVTVMGGGRKTALVRRRTAELEVIHAGYEALYGAKPAEDRSMRVKGGGA